MSLRGRLILLFFAGTMLVWVPVNYFLYSGALTEIDELWDIHLARSARVLLGNVVASVEPTKVDDLRELLAGLVPDQIPPANDLHRQFPFDEIQNRPAFVFQIFRRDGSLVFQSEKAPDVPLAKGVPGFSYRVIDGTAWRVFGVADPKSALILYAGENHAARKALAWHLVEHLVFPSLLAIPPLLLLIWVAVTKGLMPLSQLVKDVRQRAPTDLHPLSAEAFPTEIRPLIDSLNSLFARLERAMENERHFTGNAAHELRTPLAALRMQAQVAQRATDETQRQHALNKTITVVDHASHLVDQLLTLARLDSLDTSLTMDAVDLDEIARRVADDLGPLARQHRAHIQVLGNGNSVSPGDKTCLEILVRNLLDNAIRYGGGEVTVTLQHLGLFNRLIVRDQGPGIAEGRHGDMFRRFHRGDDGQTSGSGLGLSIVRRICELHGGRAELRNRKQGGGYCEVWLPATGTRPRALSSEPPPPRDRVDGFSQAPSFGSRTEVPVDLQ